MAAAKWKKTVSFGVALSVTVFLAVEYVLALGPVTKREGESACRALSPSLQSPVLGTLPTLAPDFQAQDYTGKMVSLSAYRGRVVFLNFWATWCPPCVEEMPSMEVMTRELGDEPFTVLGLASASSWPAVRSFFPSGTSMTVLLDPPEEGAEIGKQASRYGTTKLPETYLIDKQGRIRYYFVNMRDWKTPTAMQCLRSLINE
ncbi:MAG: TlpA family protein disulfide reductase [Deltaproteobacteria bacterium]|nr:TlpA family protein disulfide reductase [Deltaproteobacteria bacterium]